MREIKFRAWDKHKNMWIQVSEVKCLILYGDGKLAFDDGYGTIPPGCLGYPSINDIEIMQYTGIKDKNGKEIYEGDIVTGNPYAEDGKIHGQSGRIDPLVIEIPDCFFLCEGGLYPEESKIIGNIYENPELLK